ncbi:MAG: serine hydrolase [Ignavibacteriaceae bacterium]
MAQQNKTPELRENINSLLTDCKGEIAVAYFDLESGDSVLINENTSFHAASTMKTPVMVEVFRQAELGKFSLTDSILVKNEFRSIVDSSLYSMEIGDDSGEDLYKLLNQKTTIYNLVFQMITVSSNLSTNILIDLVGAKNVMATLNSYGIEGVNVLRGVEDNLAYRQGLNNNTTALGLMKLYKLIAEKKIISEKACDEMIKILKNQKHRSMIPALLPEGAVVATKGGSITGIRHDAGIVYLPGGREFVLVFLSKNVEDVPCINNLCARIAKLLVNCLIRRVGRIRRIKGL